VCVVDDTPAFSWEYHYSCEALPLIKMGCLCSKSRKEEKEPLLHKSASTYKAPESNKAKAVKDYNAKNSTEISFKIGQLLDIIDKTQKEYWMGQVDGQTGFGWFPSVSVVIIDEKEAIFQMEKQRIAGETLKRQNELNLSKEVSSSGQRKSMTVNTSGKVLRVQAIKAYAGDIIGNIPNSDNSASFMSFSIGDILVVTDKSKPDWWLGHIEGRTNTWGWFPVDHVEVIESES